MSKELTEAQKKKIYKILSSNERTPAHRTIGESIARHLKLSDAEYEELKDGIADCVDDFFGIPH